jgi:hypothetical protein
MDRVDVECQPQSDGWACVVGVGGDDGTRHDVRVTRDDADRLAPGTTDPTELVRRSFVFLLEREPRESILRSFDLSDIGRYFPEYERQIRGRV